MGDFLSELFDQFDQEEQARIRAAEASTTEILAQGTAAAEGRRRVAESLHDNHWLLQPENDARIDSAGVVFVAYVNALWRKTDRARAECIHDFIAKVKELIEPILTTYGWLGKDLIAQLCEECQINAQYVRSMLPPSPEKTTSSTEDSAASSPQNGTDHASGHSEATDATEQSETERGQSGDADRPVISVQPPEVLWFSDSWCKRIRQNADKNAWCARQLGRNPAEAGRQEDLLRDARAWAKATLREIVSEVQDVLELKERVVKQTEEFIQRHRYYSDFRLGSREFEMALWDEGSPSLEDLALEAVIERADSADSQAGRTARQRPSLEAVAEDEERREEAAQNLVRALQSYINKLDNANARDAVRETEIFCDYARENYASRAEARLNGLPPVDPQELFEVGDLIERRDLAGLPTIGDVFELVKRVKVRRPEHWPNPIAFHPDDDLEMRSVLRDITRREHESFQWLLEEPWAAWFRPQIRDCINECVRAKREEYALRFPTLPAADPASAQTTSVAKAPESTLDNDGQTGVAPRSAGPHGPGDGNASHDDQKVVTQVKPRQCDPLLWGNFSYERTSRTSKFRDLPLYSFVSLSVPAHRTNRDVAEQIARESHIPVESLSDDLNQPVFSRGQAIFGFAGDQFDQIADDYDNMQWWISDGGLNMAIVSPAHPGPSIPTLDELLGRLTSIEGGEDQRRSEDSRAASRKTPSQLLTEYKVLKKLRTQELVAENLGLERSVYFDLKAGRKVSEETYVKAARGLGCSPDHLKP
jgi:hypothetical protein